MEGYILVDKPHGWTSFDVVHRIRSIVSRSTGVRLKSIKVGHSGTLDPFATGLLIIMVGGKYTKQSNSLLKQDKVYDVTMELNKVSSTGDPEGEITVMKPSHKPTSSEINEAVKTFIGEISQTPPIYSAIKINGVRAYQLARDKKEVKLEPRKIFIHSLEIQSYRYPMVSFRTKVSSGTYIRSLVQDIGEVLNTGAFTKELRRIQIGNYSIQQAVSVDDINEQTIKSLLRSEL